MQLAYTLGEWDDPRAGRAIGQLATRAVGEPYLTAALMSSVNRNNLEQVLLAVLHPGGQRTAPPAGLLEKLLAMANALGDRHATVAMLGAVATPGPHGYAAWQFTALGGLVDGLEARKSSLIRLAAAEDNELRDAVQQTDAVFTAAREVVADTKANGERRRAAVACWVMGAGIGPRTSVHCSGS